RSDPTSETSAACDPPNRARSSDDSRARSDPSLRPICPFDFVIKTSPASRLRSFASVQKDMDDEHGVERTARQIQFHRLAPVDEPRFIDMKAATRAEYS